MSTHPTPPSNAPPAPRSVWRRWGLIVGVPLAMVGLALSAESLARLRHQLFPKRFGVVEPGRIYRSGQIASRLIGDVLSDNQIDVVVDLTNDSPSDPAELADKQAEIAAIDRLGIERHQHILIPDGTGDLVTYAAAVKSVADGAAAGKRVLVHCAAGSQRTGGVVALYRLLVQHKPPSEVYEEMQAFKYSVHDSPRLIEFLNGNMRDLAAELVRNGTIDEIPQNLPLLPDERLAGTPRVHQ